MTWTDTQIALIQALSAYERAEFASRMCGDQIESLWRKADALHDELLKAALVCDFEPGGRHRHLSTVDFAKQRAAAFARMFPAYVAEAEQLQTRKAA